MSNDKPVIVSEAARRLGLSRAGVYVLIRSGMLLATRFGDVWQVDAESIKTAKKRRKSGRPKSVVDDDDWQDIIFGHGNSGQSCD